MEVRANPARRPFRDYRSDSYAPIEQSVGQKHGVPADLLSRIRTRGERSNADQVSEAGARTVYQIIPETRAGIQRLYGFDPWSSPQAAAEGAALVLRDSYRRTGSWQKAVREYHGGLKSENWGPRTRAYVQRVGAR